MQSQTRGGGSSKRSNDVDDSSNNGSSGGDDLTKGSRADSNQRAQLSVPVNGNKGGSNGSDKQSGGSGSNGNDSDTLQLHSNKSWVTSPSVKSFLMDSQSLSQVFENPKTI